MIAAATAALAGLLAEPAPSNTGPDFGKASPTGLVVVVVLLVATMLLVWSMNRQLKKLPESFDRDDPGPDQEADDGTVGGGDGDERDGDPGPAPTGRATGGGDRG